MVYDYACSYCQHEIRDVEQSLHDKPLKRCPSCRKHKLERIILVAPYAAVTQDPKTLKHLADRNTKKMGTYERQSREKKEKERRKPKSKFEEVGMNVIKPDPKVERPFWRDTDTVDLSLATLTPAQQKKYIEEGVKP
jgi:putative FmdB family regulatory protein